MVWSGVDSVRDDIDRSEVTWRVGVRTMYRLVPVSIGRIGILAVCSMLGRLYRSTVKNIGQLLLLQFVQGLTPVCGTQRYVYSTYRWSGV